MSFGPYSKTIAAIVTAVLGWVAAVVVSAPEAVTSAEWLTLAVAVATALGVYAVRNEPT
jgi:hypothetical protein